MKTLFVWFNQDGFIRQIEKHVTDAFNELGIEYKSCYIEDYPDTYKSYDPVITLFFHPNKEIYRFIDVIKKHQGHKLLWDMESPYESDIVFDMAPYIYYIFTSDKATAKEIEKLNTNKVFYVPHACDPKVHKKIDYGDIPFEYKTDILLIGNAYESRIKYLQEHSKDFRNKTVTIVGIGYWGISGYQNQRFIRRHVNQEECVLYYNGAKTVLNIHRVNTDLDMNNSRKIVPEHLNNRFYELCAMGVVQVVENRDNMKEEVEKVLKQRPEEYSYTSRLQEFFIPLLK